MSASIAFSAQTILASWRSNSNDVSAPRAGREAAAEPVAVEVVEDVEGRDFQVAADSGRGRRPQVRGDEVHGADRLDPVRAEAEVHHAVEAVQRVAHAKRVRRRQATLRVPRRVVVLGVAGVVEDDPAPRVLRRHGLGGRTRERDRGRVVEASGAGEADLAEPAEVEDLGRSQRLGVADQHPFVTLVVVHVRDRESHRRRRDRPRPALHGGGDQRQLGQGEALAGGAANAHDVARADVVDAGAAEDEDALRGQRVGVGVRCFFLDVVAVELAGALDVGDDDALDRDRGVGERRRRTAALDVVDPSRRLTAVADRVGRWRLTRVRRTRRDRLDREVGVVVVGVRPVGAAGEADPALAVRIGCGRAGAFR